MKKINLKSILTVLVAVMLIFSAVLTSQSVSKAKKLNTGTCEVINGITICYADDSKEIFDKYHEEQEAKAAEEARLAAERAAAEEAARKAEAEAKAAEEARLAAERAAAEEARLAAERAAAEEAARKAEAEAKAKAEQEARAKAEAEAKAKAEAAVTIHAEEPVNNGHGYTREEVHNNASGYKKDISTVSTKKENPNGNVLNVSTQKELEEQVFNLMNETRAKVNAAPLVKTDLNAETWADMMLETGLFEHAKLFNEYKYEGTTKVVTKEVSAGVGDNWSSAGENIAWRSYSPDEMAATYLNGQWNKSTGHYNNRINASWKYYDVSIVKGADGQWYAVERFAR